MSLLVATNFGVLLTSFVRRVGLASDGWPQLAKSLPVDAFPIGRFRSTNGARQRGPTIADWVLAVSEPNSVLLGFAGRTRNENVNQGFAMSAVNILPSESDWTPKEVAARLRVCRRTIEREVAAKRFPPPFKVGLRCLRFRREDVEAYERNGGMWPPKTTP